jgi:UDP-N-acetylmuramoylalanine--D-glutamate ligase
MTFAASETPANPTQNWLQTPPRCMGILGLSRSGTAAARLAQAYQVPCWVSEFKALTPDTTPLANELAALGVQLETGGHSDTFLAAVDAVVTSPGIPPTAPMFNQLAQRHIPVVSELDLGWWANQLQTNAPVAAITGTNGKTTTTSLVGHMAKTAGWTAPLCGNIGHPLADATRQTPKAQAYIVEVSSFQLHFSQVFQPHVAAYLNLTPDHVTWHGSLAAYQSAKAKLFLPPLAPQIAVLNWDDPVCRALADDTPAQVIAFSLSSDPTQHPKVVGQLYFDPSGVIMTQFPHQSSPTELLLTQDLILRGPHNHANVMAAAAVAWCLGIPQKAIVDAAKTFAGVEHRLEYVTTSLDCPIYNDSKATNPEAAIPAIRAFSPQKVVLLAGGQDKLTSLDAFVAAVQAHADAVVLFGEAADRFAEALAPLQAATGLKIHRVQTLQQACSLALKTASRQPIVLSPACASFDQFTDYEDRGRQFKAIMLSLSLMAQPPQPSGI